jgi:hypothetical protein
MPCDKDCLAREAARVLVLQSCVWEINKAVRSVLQNVASLLTKFEDISGPIMTGTLVQRREGSADVMRAIELPMLAAFDRLGRKVQAGELRDDHSKFLRSYFRASHYKENIWALLALILEVQDSVTTTEQAISFGRRIALDVEKLVTDIRSLLDEVHRLSLYYCGPKELALMSKGGRRSFGGFADLFEEAYGKDQPERFAKLASHDFGPPLSFLREICPWGQTIREIRDGYIHHGSDSLVFFVDGSVCIYLDLNIGMVPRPTRRGFPDLFYPKGNRNPLILLKKLLVYLVAPLLALDQAIGDYLSSLQEYRFGDEAQPSSYRVDTGLYTLLAENEDVLDPALYTQQFLPVIVIDDA